MALAATLTINSVQTPFLGAWQANQTYTSGNDGSYIGQYTDVIVDSNGNYQVRYQSGTSGSSMPDFAATAPGDFTADGANPSAWVCCQLYDTGQNLIPYFGIITLGSSVNMTWTSTDAVSVTLNGNDIALNGTGDFTPGLNQFDPFFDTLYLGFISGFSLSIQLSLTVACSYVLVATDSLSNTYTVKQYFALCGAVSLVQTDVPVPVDIVVTGPQGDSGASGNTGFCVQRGFGPIWNNPSSQIGCSFAGLPIPSSAIAPAYADSTSYAFGDIVSLGWDLDAPGIPLLCCVQAGTSGTGGVGRPLGIIGSLFPDSALHNPSAGGTAVWQELGSILITLQWTGSYVPARDGYPGGPDLDMSNPTGPLGRPADGIPVEITKYGDVNNFIVNPAEAATYCEPFNTATIPTPGPCGSSLTWFVTGLGSGYINQDCALGFRVNIATSVSSFFVPQSDVTPPPTNTGLIVVQKVTQPSGSPQSFSFSASWGESFTLLDGESHTSPALDPGTYTVQETAVANWLTTTSSDPLNINVVANETTTITFTNRKQSGYLLARDLNTWGDRGTQGDPAANDADLYSQCFVIIGSMQLSTPGAQLMEVRHVVGYFDAVGTLGIGGGPSQPFVSVLPNEIAATNGAQFINLPETVTEPPYGATASRSLQQLRWPLTQWADDQTSLLMHHLQVKLLFGPENAPNTIKMIAIKSDQE